MKLTIAIPTFNFGRFIGPTLRSILAQRARLDAPDDVEVVVVDGASTDDTAQVVGELSADVRYVRLERRGGIDVDMDHAVRAARGTYVWLFSADDLLADGALTAVLRQLQASPEIDVLLGTHTNCDRETMAPLEEHPVFRDRGPRLANLGRSDDRQAWLAAAVSTEAVFSFMSTIIVRRDLWMQASERRFVGTCWSHVARLFGMAAAGPLRCQYRGEIWVHRRSGNDSFMDKGLVHRLRLAFFLVDIFRHLFGEGSPEHRHVHRMLRWEQPRPEIINGARSLVLDPSRERRDEWGVLVEERYPTNAPYDVAHRLFFKRIPTQMLVRGLDAYHASPLPGLRARFAAFTKRRRGRSATAR